MKFPLRCTWMDFRVLMRLRELIAVAFPHLSPQEDVHTHTQRNSNRLNGRCLMPPEKVFAHLVPLKMPASLKHIGASKSIVILFCVSNSMGSVGFHCFILVISFNWQDLVLNSSQRTLQIIFTKTWPSKTGSSGASVSLWCIAPTVCSAVIPVRMAQMLPSLYYCCLNTSSEFRNDWCYL